mgnify:CR=1 FL=1
MAAFTEIVIEQGATFETTVEVNDVYNNAVNLANYSTESQMRKSYNSSTSYTIDTSITDETNGEITLSITAANTANLPAGRMLYDLKITSNTGISTRVVEGIAVILPAVTR